MEQMPDVSTPIMEQPAQEVAAQDEVVYAADLIKPETPKADAQEKPAAQVQPEKPKTAPAKSQEEIDRALSARLKDAERKARVAAESTPEFLAGKIAIDMRAAKDGVSREEAAKRIQQEFEAEENKRLADNPVELVKTLRNMYKPDPTPAPKPDAQPPTFEQFQSEAQQIVAQAYTEGLLPDGYEVTPDVVVKLFENRANPVKLAAFLRTLSPAASVDQDADANAAQPSRTSAPIRTTSENARTMEKDWRDVPDKEFADIVEEVKNQTREGKKVRF